MNKNNGTLIEVCCSSVEDAILAEKAGAHRVELNSSIALGGITPSIGTIKNTIKSIHIPVMVMIRPREGGFCYSDYELESMEEDIYRALEAGAQGIVFGALNADGTINIKACKKFMNIIGNKESVFHRAFDVVKDPYCAIEQLIELNVNRILTKGQKNTVEEGAGLLKKLMDDNGDNIEILTGGVRPHNVEWMIKEMKFNQLHLAGFKKEIDLSLSHHPDVYFGSPLNPEESSYDKANYNYLKDMCEKIKGFSTQL